MASCQIEVSTIPTCYLLTEYCNMESFDATCPEGDVILMTHAQFGQMRLGRCIEVDLGYVGCYGDVLGLLDRTCSGKTSCSVAVGGRDMASTSNCAKSLMQYLEADYKCVKGNHCVLDSSHWWRHTVLIDLIHYQWTLSHNISPFQRINSTSVVVKHLLPPTMLCCSANQRSSRVAHA